MARLRDGAAGRGGGPQPGASRRQFLKAAALAGASVTVEARRADAQTPPAPAPAGIEPGAGGSAGFFAPRERELLARLADEVLPGASRLGAVDYVEQLLTAFDHDPPRIFGGGPFSGRHPDAGGGPSAESPPENDFARFVPLNRVQERAWRLRLFGSGDGGVAPLAGVEPAPGLRAIVGGAARQAVRLADAGEGRADRIWSELPEAFRDAFSTLVVEGCLGDPVYGGNRDRRGWAAIYFEGDSLPLGYTPWDEAAGAYRERPDAPVSTLEAGDGPEPLGFWTRVMLWILSFVSRRTELL